MTASDRFDRVFADVLADLAQPAYPDYIEGALDVATRKRQRPAWAFPERWLPMTSLTRAAPFAPNLRMRRLLLVALVALLLAAIALAAIGSLRRVAPPFGPAANGVLAYQVDGDIHTLDLGSGMSHPLFTGNTFDVFPHFSGDGTKFAFFRYAPGTEGAATDPSSLVVANADGSGERVLAGPALFDWFAWGPNSQELAVLEKVDGRMQLSMIGVDGSRRAVAVDSDVQIEGLVGWRPPDGREIILQARKPGASSSYYALKPDGTGVRRIMREGLPENGREGAITPDGRYLVFTRLQDPITARIVDLETGTVRTFGAALPVPEGGTGVGPMHVAMLQLSSDGTKIVLGRYWDGDRGDDQINHQVWVASLAGDGEDAVPVSPVVRSQGGTLPFVVFVAPDGSQIVVHRLETNVTWISDGNGLNRRQADWGRLYETDWQRMAP